MRHRFRRWGIVLRKVVRRIVYSRRSANSVAWGIALGVFIGFTPTFGFQMIIAAFFATLLGVSRLAAILPVWISNPFTLAPLYYFNFRVGALFLPAARAARVRGHLAVVAQRVNEVSVSDFLGTMSAALGEMGRLSFDVLVPLVVGSIIVGATAAAASYPVALWAVAFVRRRRRSYSIHRADERLERLEREGLYSKVDADSRGPVESEGRATAEGTDAARPRPSTRSGRGVREPAEQRLQEPDGEETDGPGAADETRRKPLGPISPGARDDEDGDPGSNAAPAAGATGSQ
jgi:uncharacterized protein (DUF2062 family)